MTDIKKEHSNLPNYKSKSLFLEAFESAAGNISVSCKKVGISRETFYRWYKEDTEFAQSVQDIKEGLIDMAETVLLKNIREGQTAELIFFLKTIGKKRGYVERTEIDMTNKAYDLSKFTNEELLAYINDAEHKI